MSSSSWGTRKDQLSHSFPKRFGGTAFEPGRDYNTQKNSRATLLTVSGCGTLAWPEAQALPICQGSNHYQLN